MPTYTFTGPTRKAVRKGSCPACGKPATRSATFANTVSPFNKRSDGTPKTWAEVAADVKAEAEAWDPPAELFEHDKCKAARLAPPVAAPVPVSPERADATRSVLAAMDQVGQFVQEHGLALGKVELSYWRDELTVQVAFLPGAEIVAWARAFGMEFVPVEDGGHCTYIRLRHVQDGLKWEVDAYVSKPGLGDRLGGCPVDWTRNVRTGKRNGFGTAHVDDLADGLARMGIAVVVPGCAS